mmetsp:Transcript_36704/g.80255  ORF Transcript_36704/g.80255 Transcript_36704/m.80255 type:complete len:437 (+) Transcript_36704:149-1459(+)
MTLQQLQQQRLDNVRDDLQALGVDVAEPESRKELAMADALQQFADFVLLTDVDTCAAILDRHMDKTVGALQGGSDLHDIYRVSIEPNSAATELLNAFYASRQGRRCRDILTISKLRHYMLALCDKRRSTEKRYTKLGNFMFILCMGPVNGQVHHIDLMAPNLQLCLYMSEHAASTVVCEMDGPQISNSQQLLAYWEGRHGAAVPKLVHRILLDHSDTPLSKAWYTRHYGFWGSIDAHLQNFGQLYRPVKRRLSFEADPGTMQMGPGNSVHAGPPTTGPRMFAFAIGIPEHGDDDDRDSEENNGEVQYNPVLLHVDLCCILFTLMEMEYGDCSEQAASKEFLVDLLVPFVKQYPKETYQRLLGDDRAELRGWLGRLASTINDATSTRILLEEAAANDSIVCSPDVLRNPKKRSKRKSRRPKERSTGSVATGIVTTGT